MSKREILWQKITQYTDLTEETMPGQTIVELAGHDRVLIENHFGVKAYGEEKMVIRARYGYVHICGQCLKLQNMSRERLLISGRIQQIHIHRGH